MIYFTMILELALIILIIIMAVTEFFKYTNIFGLMSYVNMNEIQNDCYYARELFNENDLYKRNIDDRIKL